MAPAGFKPGSAVDSPLRARRRVPYTTRRPNPHATIQRLDVRPVRDTEAADQQQSTDTIQMLQSILLIVILSLVLLTGLIGVGEGVRLTGA